MINVIKSLENTCSISDLHMKVAHVIVGRVFGVSYIVQKVEEGKFEFRTLDGFYGACGDKTTLKFLVESFLETHESAEVFQMSCHEFANYLLKQ